MDNIIKWLEETQGIFKGAPLPNWFFVIIISIIIIQVLIAIIKKIKKKK